MQASDSGKAKPMNNAELARELTAVRRELREVNKKLDRLLRANPSRDTLSQADHSRTKLITPERASELGIAGVDADESAEEVPDALAKIRSLRPGYAERESQ